MSSDPSKIITSNEELFTVRDAMRELNRIIDRMDRGEIEKAVLTKHGKMVAVVCPVGCSPVTERTYTIFACSHCGAQAFQHPDDPPTWCYGTTADPHEEQFAAIEVTVPFLERWQRVVVENFDSARLRVRKS